MENNRDVEMDDSVVKRDGGKVPETVSFEEVIDAGSFLMEYVGYGKKLDRGVSEKAKKQIDLVVEGVLSEHPGSRRMASSDISVLVSSLDRESPQEKALLEYVGRKVGPILPILADAIIKNENDESTNMSFLDILRFGSDFLGEKKPVNLLVDAYDQIRINYIGGKFDGGKYDYAGKVFLFMYDNVENKAGAFTELNRLSGEVLTNYGLDPNELMRAWSCAGYSMGGDSGEHGDEMVLKRWRSHLESYFENIRIIRKIETARPGSAHYLNKRYGIRHFSRYNPELLIDQYDRKERGKSEDIQTIAVIYPYDDHNGAFVRKYNDRLDNFFLEAKKNGVDLVVAEAKTGREALGRLLRIAREQGQLMGARIGGHGTRESVQFGPKSRETNSVKSTDILHNIGLLKNAGAKIFKPGARIIFESCSTGQEGGIVSVIAETLKDGKVRVTGPKIPIGSQEVVFDHDEQGQLIIKPIYSKGDMEGTYVGGGD